MPESNSTPSTPKPARKSRIKRSAQDQQIANEISTAEQAITGAMEQTDVLARLKPRSYDEKELKKGLSLQEAAQEAFNTRQQRAGTAAQAKQMRDTAEKTAREQFSDYRQTCQANYLRRDDRKALGASGRVPTDIEKFITTARAAYTAAGQVPYGDTLAVYGYDEEKLKEAFVGLASVAEAEGEYRARAGEAKGATKDRDTAHREMKKWFGKFKKIAKLALKGQPGLREMLKI
ncbi:MAG TPA: hypothetical protein VI454_09480 [Verrucomicrobiae bacterium]|jgi:hypothetical protein